MRGFSVNLQGRIKNFNLPKNQPLIPLFEAIVNSIHAIDERKKSGESFEGHITVNIIREGQMVMEIVGELPAISTFEITDNGVGFNERNMMSFTESDSSYKASIGGKGVGRFSWLLAFQKAKIESVYAEHGQYVKREFIFSTEQPEINDTLSTCETQNDNCTTVRLINCMKPYIEHLPKRGNTVAMQIIQHCLVYFISEDCPQITLIDGNDTYNLNQLFKEKIKTEENTVQLVVNDEVFELLHVKAEDTMTSANKLYLCAHNRLVETKELEKYIVDLDREFYKNSKFWYIGVLRGSYLDDNVDMNRLSFRIPDGGQLNSMLNMITMDHIMDAVVVEINRFLSDYLAPIATQKIERITQYTIQQAPQFRHLLKYMSESIAQIKPNLTDDKLDDELHRIKREFDRSTTQENHVLLQQLKKNVISTEEYTERFKQQIEKVNSANSAALAEYVAHRKVILELMEFAIRHDNWHNYQKEKFLHNLVYPMRTTSSDLPYSSHNLWLIDEKLAYCNYIASDIPNNNDPKEKRTDIMILDNPVAVSDEANNGREYETIVLFELKRPMRNDYDNNKNPIEQLVNYAELLQSNKVRDKDGRLIRTGDNTKFYLYAICDITSTLENYLRRHDYYQTPDKMGYYIFKRNMRAYIEVLSYDKIINDANKRNQILFDKLGI